MRSRRMKVFSVVFIVSVWTGKPGGVHSPKFWVGVCRMVLKTLTPFHTKIYDFSYPFSDLTPKICTPFQT